MMSFESPKEKGSDVGYIEKSGKGRQRKWKSNSQTEHVVSTGLVEPKPIGSDSPEEVTEEDVKVEISSLSSDTISFLRQVSGNGIPTALWSPEILRGLREAGFVVESVTPEFSPDSSIGVACTDTRNRLQEFVLNPREAIALLNSAVSLYDDEVKNESEKKPGKNQKKLLDVNASKIKTHFSVGQTLNVHRLEREMNNLKYTSEVPVSVYPHRPEVIVDHSNVPLLNHGSLKEDTVDFLHWIVSTNMWVPDLEASLAREGFSNSSNDIESSGERVYTYKTSDGRVQRYTLTPESALSMLQRAVEIEQPIVQHEEELVIEVKASEQNSLPIGITEIVSERKRGEQKSFDTRFETEFGITEEQILQIEGFERLSEGQQKLVFENLTQLTLGRVQEESARLSAEYTGNRREEMEGRFGKLLGNVFSSAREAFTKGYSELKTEQQVAEEMRTGGFDVHKNLLEQLIQGMNTRGPRVHENENGELVVDLVNIRDRASGEQRGPEYVAMTELNKVAHEFAKIPAEWRAQTLGVDTGEEWGITTFFKEKVFKMKEKVHAQTYKEKEAQYTNAKKQLEFILRQRGKSDLEIAQTLLGIDSRVTQLQAIQTNPDAIAELEKIKDKNFWIESAKKLVSGPGIYMGLGAAGRTVLGVGLGIIAAPITSAGVAYIRSWNKTAAELRERDRNARGGVKDVGEGALNIVSAESLTEKTKYLIDRYKNTFSPEDRVRLLAQLRARAEYIHDKQMLHRVDYGSREQVVTSQTNLSRVLGEAFAVLADEDFASSKTAEYRFGEVRDRLNRQLKNTEDRIIATRRVNRVVDQQTSAGKAVLFSIAGVAIAEQVADYWNEIKPKVGIVGGVVGVGSTASVAGSGEAPLPKQYGYQAEVRAVDNEILKTMRTETDSSYVIQKGDTLTKILKEKVPSIQGLGHTRAQENAVVNILRSLTSNEMDSIGLRSHSIENIRVDDSIDVEKLNAIIAEKQSIIESAQNRFGDEPVRSYTEASPRSGSQQGEIVKDAGVSLKVDEVVTSGKDAGDIVLEQQAEVAPKVVVQEENLPEKPSVNVEPDVSDVGNSRVGTVEGNALSSESTSPNYAEDGGTVLDSESNTPEAESVSNIPGSQETFKNTHGVEVNPKKEHIYELTGQGGEKVMVSYGGKDFGTRFDTAQEYVQKNPEAVVVVEQKPPRYGAFGQKLPPVYVEVRNVPGEGVTTIFSIQDDTLPASSEKGIDPSTFTKKVTE